MKKNFTFLFLLVLIIINSAPAQVQILKSSNYKTQYNTQNLASAAFYGDCWTLDKARSVYGDNVYYYEYSARAGWYSGSNSAYVYPFPGMYRQTSLSTGETINGNYAVWLFDVDTSTNYIVYCYTLTSGNAASDCYYKFRRFGESASADSIRFDMRKNNTPRYMSVPLASTVGYGVWVPMTIIPIYKGSKSLEVTLGADTLTGFSLIRANAVRILKSDTKGPDLEFGRRSALAYDTTRIEEEWGDVGLGNTLDKDIPVYNLGNQNLVITNVSFVLNTGRFSTITTLPLTVAPGKQSSIKVRFRPYQEEFSTDTLVIESNDALEPKAPLPISGRGINYYFILNAADPNKLEPNFNAPYDIPNDANRPRYQEMEENIPSPSWINSGSVSPYIYPIPNGNFKSRVNTSASGISRAIYTFTLPPDKFGTYILEYSGPFYSTNATSKCNVIVKTAFVSDSGTAVFSEESLETDGLWRQIGTTWSLNGGAPSSIQFWNLQDAVSAGGEYLRADLLRIRKIPSSPTISSDYGYKTYYFTNVSAYDSERAKNPLSNKYQFTINSNGESLIRIDSIYLRRGYYYKISEKMKFPIQVPAVNGKLTFTIEFNPNIIFDGYVDTIMIKSNASNYPSMFIRLYGTAVGDLVVADDLDAQTTIYPATPVDFAAVSDPTTYGKWYFSQSGYASRSLLGYIYQLKGDPDANDPYKKKLAYVEWFPNFPLAHTGTGAVADSFDVSIVLPAGSSNSNPTAKYVVYEYGGKQTVKIMSQNAYDATLNPTGVQSSGEIPLGRFQFLRGGKDAHNSGAIFGHVELWNDTSLVSDYYRGVSPNPAKIDSFVTRADAIYFREAAKPGQTLVAEPAVPREFSLSQNYPNPFNPSTTIRFSLPQLSKVEIKIYDMLGREVRTLINERLMPGAYSLEWNGKNNYNQNVSSGAYFYRIITDKHMVTKKMLLMK